MLFRRKITLTQEADANRPQPQSHNSRLWCSEFVFSASFTIIKSFLLLITLLISSYALLLVCTKHQHKWSGQVCICCHARLLSYKTECCLLAQCFWMVILSMMLYTSGIKHTLLLYQLSLVLLLKYDIIELSLAFQLCRTPELRIKVYCDSTKKDIHLGLLLSFPWRMLYGHQYKENSK